MIGRKFYTAIPYIIQAIGFVIMCSFIVGLYFHKFQANAEALQVITVNVADHEKRMAAIEKSDAVINQKLDDMIVFFHVPRSEKK